MRDPVFVAGSGNTYEREAIETFWRGRGPRRDPLTNQELANAAMYTNWDKRREVAAWLSRHPNRIPEGWPDRDVPPPADERGDRGRRRPATIVPRELDDLVRRPVAVAAATPPPPSPPSPSPSSRPPHPRGHYPSHPRGAPSRRSIRSASPPLAGSGRPSGGPFGFSSAAPRDHPEKISAAAPAGDRTRDPDVAALERFAALADDMRAARAPSGSRVLARRGPDGALEIIVPPLGLLNPKSLAELGFAAVWSAFTGAWTFGAARGPAPAFALFSLPFWGVGAHLGKVTACAALETTRLVLVPPRVSAVDAIATASLERRRGRGRGGRRWSFFRGVGGARPDHRRGVRRASRRHRRRGCDPRVRQRRAANRVGAPRGGSIARRRPGITQSRTGVRGAIGGRRARGGGLPAIRRASRTRRILREIEALKDA